MEITIEKLLDGKSTIIKGKEYFETKEYCSPFIDLMKKFTNDFVVEVQEPNQVTITNDKEDITYNRVWIQAVMPSKCDKDGYAETYNLVYGLDVRQPVYKVFKAYKDRKSSNLYVFDSQWLNVYELKPSTKFIEFEQVIKNLMEKTDDSETRFKMMKETVLSSDVEDRQQNLGSWIEGSMLYNYSHKGGKVKLSPQSIIKAYQSIYMDSSSKFFVSDTEESSLFNAYDAISTLITQDVKDIINRWEKCYLIGQIINSEICK